MVALDLPNRLNESGFVMLGFPRSQLYTAFLKKFVLVQVTYTP